MISQENAAKVSLAMARGKADLLDAVIHLFANLPEVLDATLLAVSADQTAARRIGSSNEKMFPRDAGEPLDPADPWCHKILVEKQPVLANDKAALALYITEASAIEAAGFGASGSFPIVIGGRVAGTINMLAPEGHFTAARVATIEALLPFAALIFLFPQTDPV